MTTKNPIKKIIYYFPIKLLPAFSTLFFITYLYKNLPSGDYSKYSISISLAIVLTQVLGGWVNNSYIYFHKTVLNEGDIATIFLKLKNYSSLVGFFSAFFLSKLFISDKLTSLLISFLVASQINFYFFSSYFQNTYQIRPQLYSTFFQSFSQILILLFLFNIYNPSFSLGITSTLIGILIATTFLTYKARTTYKNLNIVYIPVINIIKYGLPLSLWTLSILLINFGDRFIIDALSIGTSDQYLSVRDLLIGASGLLSMPILMVLHPFILEKSKNHDFPYKLLLKTIILLSILFLILFSFWTTVGSYFYFSFTQKENNIDRLFSFILISGIFVNCANIYAQKKLEADAATLKLTGISLTALLLFIILALLLGKFFGLIGIATSNLIANLFYFSVTIPKKIKTYFPIKNLKILSVSIIHTFAAIWSWTHVINNDSILISTIWTVIYAFSSAFLIFIAIKDIQKELM
ncbi:hypothetical protein [Alcaligenes aquatilis]|uniref:hypothetical protein n=1 Tax=Alcaligenes aquatilis TaxID=323284 RepID=UPI0013CF0CA1|nr:hypothetical protein [Alcaligenes aquatilis]